MAAWDANSREGLSAMALAAYGSLAGREDVHAAFYLGPEGAAPSWLQPEYISPGLAALMVLAPGFIALPNLSASSDTNHYVLASQLPVLGWTADEIEFLVQGQPIETMLQSFAERSCQLQPGGFRYTGGWTSGLSARTLSERLDRLAQGLPLDANEMERSAWRRLNESNALHDARAMLSSLTADDWLVMAITH